MSRYTRGVIASSGARKIHQYRPTKVQTTTSGVCPGQAGCHEAKLTKARKSQEPKTQSNGWHCYWCQNGPVPGRWCFSLSNRQHTTDNRQLSIKYTLPQVDARLPSNQTFLPAANRRGPATFRRLHMIVWDHELENQN